GPPTRSLRTWGEDGVIVVGESHTTGTDEASPDRWTALEDWTTERFAVTDFAYRWSAQDFSTVDGTPYVGRSPRTRNTFVATGFHKWGLTNGTAAGAMIADEISGRTNPWTHA